MCFPCSPRPTEALSVSCLQDRGTGAHSLSGQGSRAPYTSVAVLLRSTHKRMRRRRRTSHHNTLLIPDVCTELGEHCSLLPKAALLGLSAPPSGTLMQKIAEGDFLQCCSLSGCRSSASLPRDLLGREEARAAWQATSLSSGAGLAEPLPVGLLSLQRTRWFPRCFQLCPCGECQSVRKHVIIFSFLFKLALCWFSEPNGLVKGDRLAPGQGEEGAAGPGGISLAIIKSWSYSFSGKLSRKEERVLLMCWDD